MDSIKLASLCYTKGFLSKKAMEEVLCVRERLIKEAIAMRIANPVLISAKKLKNLRTKPSLYEIPEIPEESLGFLGKMKKSLGLGSIEKAHRGGDSSGLEWSQTIGNLVKLLGAGAALQAGAAGVGGIIRHSKDKKLEGQIKNSYTEMLKVHPKLQELNRSDVSRNFGVLARYAPSIAADPTVAGSWVVNATMSGHVDPMIIKQLSETQNSIDRAHQERSLTQPGQFSRGIQLAQQVMG